MNREFTKWLQRLLRGELQKARRRKRSAPLLIAVLVVALFLISRYLEEPDAPRPAKGTELVCNIGEVYDGDTVAASCAQGKLTVRIFGIDAPEMGQKPWGEQSRNQLRTLLPNASLRFKVLDTDRYGRAVAQMYDGERDLGLEMVRQGQAVVYQAYNSDENYQSAQRQAKRQKLGVWARPGAQQTPWEWRKLNPR